MVEFWAIRIGNALHSDGDESFEVFDKIPIGKSVRVKVEQPRNSAHHRLFFALCQRIASAKGETLENVVKQFKRATGHYEINHIGPGVQEVDYKSIAFHNMGQIEFSEFFEKCVQAAYEAWGIEPKLIADLLVPQEAHAR
jgi:hypothetical protein